ncbi:MAG: IS1595 family transposase [Paracoccaceae bacterium]
MDRFPDSLIAFQRMFPDEAACAAWLASVRWPEGFECPRCAHDHGWALRGKAHTIECARCHRQTSVTAGTIVHASKLSLTVWFWAAYLLATHSNGISALQLQKQLGIGSYRSAWLLAAKLRRAMVDPERNRLAGLVEVDETGIPFRTKHDPSGGGRSHQGKLLVAGAVEVREGGKPGRLRLAAIADFSAASLHAFLATGLATGATAKTDGWAGYPGAPNLTHKPHVIGPMAAHIVLPWIHQVFSNLKGWARGVYHGLRAKHLQSYLDEFVFRFNRRRTRHAAFHSLFQIAVHTTPTTYNMLVKPELSA